MSHVHQQKFFLGGAIGCMHVKARHRLKHVQAKGGGDFKTNHTYLTGGTE